MSGVAIFADQLGKQYRIGSEQRYSTIRDSLARTAKHLARWKPAPATEPFWALRDLTFEVRQGEVLGIIGRNGAGKSTLLKILARVTEPTVGKARLTGRVGSLLEIGAGFHPELTGRENIYLNGAVLGMSRAEITGKFAEIVAFSEVERFLDTPVKHFSTGMFMRLAFSVAAHLESEILLMDEALAVGDATFTNKCLLRLRDAAKDGRTVFLVSHNMHAISQLCSRVILLDHGRIVQDGPAGQVIDAYLQRSAPAGMAANLADRIAALSEDPSFRLMAVRCLQKGVETSAVGNGEPVSIVLTYRIKQPIAGFRLAFDLCDLGNTIIFRSHHDGDADRIGTAMPGVYESTAVLPAELLAPRNYQVVLRATEYNIRHLIPEGVLSFPLLVRSSGRVDRAYVGDTVHGLISPMIPWTTRPAGAS